MMMMSSTTTPTMMMMGGGGEGGPPPPQQQQVQHPPSQAHPAASQRQPIMFSTPFRSYFQKNDNDEATPQGTTGAAAPPLPQQQQQQQQQQPQQRPADASSPPMFPILHAYLQHKREEHENKELIEKEKRGLLHKLLALKITSSLPLQQGDDYNEQDDNIKVMEDLIAQQNESMTFEEKERAAFDVHGLSAMNTSYLQRNELGGDIAMEDNGPSLVEQTKLVDLDTELRKLRVDMTNPLVQSEEFRLMFLRCDELDVKVAAQRIKKNLQLRKELFGPACCRRHLEYSDLSPEDQQAVQSGVIKISPLKDSVGRTVVIHCPNLRPGSVSMESKQRAGFYTWSLLARQPSVQRNGVVVLIMFHGLPFGSRENGLYRLQQYMWGVRPINAALPRKIAAAHMCIDTSTAVGGNGNAASSNIGDSYKRRMFTAISQLMCRDDVRKRFRTHTGIRRTLEFQLGAYGITLNPEDWPQPTQQLQQQSQSQHQQQTRPSALSASQPSPSPTTTNQFDSHDYEFNYNDTRGAFNFVVGGGQQEMSLSETSMESSENSITTGQTNQSTTFTTDAGMMEESDTQSIISTTTTTTTTPAANGMISTTGTMDTTSDPTSPTSVAVVVTTTPNNNNIANDSIIDDGSKIIPTDNDVLFGRGKNTRNHPGNLYAMSLVNRYRDEYEQAKKFEKTAIAERIVQIIASGSSGSSGGGADGGSSAAGGGRFLKYDNSSGNWIQVDSQTARNKISHLYRNTRNRGSGLSSLSNQSTK